MNIRQFIIPVICDAKLRDFIIYYNAWHLKDTNCFVCEVETDPDQGFQIKLGSNSDSSENPDPFPAKIFGSEPLDSFLFTGPFPEISLKFGGKSHLIKTILVYHIFL